MVDTGMVEILMLNGETYNIQYDPALLLGDFKRLVETQTGLEVERQRLALGITILQGDLKSLDDLGVKAGATLTLGKSRYPKPTIRDSAKVKELLDANDFDGLAKAAELGYHLDVKYDGLYDLLHTAVMKGDLEIVELLLETGVSVFSITRSYPKTALQVAAKFNHKDICAFLMEKGLDPHEKNFMTSDGSHRTIENWDAVQYAAENGHKDLADWLRARPSPVRKPTLAASTD